MMISIFCRNPNTKLNPKPTMRPPDGLGGIYCGKGANLILDIPVVDGHACQSIRVEPAPGHSKQLDRSGKRALHTLTGCIEGLVMVLPLKLKTNRFYRAIPQGKPNARISIASTIVIAAKVRTTPQAQRPRAGTIHLTTQRGIVRRSRAAALCIAVVMDGARTIDKNPMIPVDMRAMMPGTPVPTWSYIAMSPL
jgi:hypothetical protein